MPGTTDFDALVADPNFSASLLFQDDFAKLKGCQFYAGPEGLRQTVGQRWPQLEDGTYAAHFGVKWLALSGPVPVRNRRGEQIGIATVDADGSTLAFRFPGRSGELLLGCLWVAQMKGTTDLRIQLEIIDQPEADTPVYVQV